MQVISLIVSFLCRTIFTKIMGAEYLGISGLFTNILTILSFAELGIGSAIVFRLYAPLFENDTEKVKQYLVLYKKIYRIIIAVVSGAGIVFIPFLKYLVTAPNVKESVVLLYCLYLANTVLSYLFIYKKSLLIADQNDYIVSIITQMVTLIINVAQCIMLVLTRNFVLYCLCNCLCTLLGNICCSIYVNKHYSYLKEKPKGNLSKNEIRGLFSDVKGLLLTKIASVAFSGTDNIFISTFIGIKYVGILSNYTLILTMVNDIMNKVFSSVTASIGNLVAEGDLKQTENVLYRMYFVNTSMYGLMCVGMILLLQQFVSDIWLDSTFYLSSPIIVFAVIELFIRSIHYPIHTVQNALGLFSQYRIVYVIAALGNIVLDFMLVKKFGICGLFFATILCRGLTYVVDIYVVYHFGFMCSAKKYIVNLIKWALFLLLAIVVGHFVLELILIKGIIGFILKVLCVIVLYLILFFAVYRKNSDFAYLICMIKQRIFKKQ